MKCQLPGGKIRPPYHFYPLSLVMRKSGDTLQIREQLTKRVLEPEPSKVRQEFGNQYKEIWHRICRRG
jgi:hypothetical protein